MKTSPSDCPPRRTRVHATPLLKWPRLLRISFHFFPRPRPRGTSVSRRSFEILLDRSSNMEYTSIWGERGKGGGEKFHLMGIRYRFERISNESSSCLQEYCISARSSVRFPLSLSLSLTLRSHALASIVFFVRTILVVVVVERDWEYRFLSRS